MTHGIAVRLSCALVALLTSLPALAQDGPVAQCLQAMAQATQHAVQETADRTGAVIGHLEDAAANGASDEQLVNIAARGKVRATAPVRRAKTYVANVSQRCIDQLQANGAPPPVILRVVRARNHALATLDGAGDRSFVAIDRKLRQLVSG